MIQSPDTKKVMSRRNFLKFGIALAAVATGQKIGNLFEPTSAAAPANNQLPRLDQDEPGIPDQVEIPTPEAVLTDTEKQIFNQELFARCTPEEKLIAIRLVKKELDNFNNQHGITTAIDQVLQHQDMVQFVLNQLEFRQNSFVRQFLLPMIFTESSGNSKIGLTQIQPGTLEDVLKIMPDKDKKLLIYKEGRIDLSDPKTSITLAASLLHELYTAYPDPALTLLAYNTGRGRLTRCIKIYMNTTYPDLGPQLVENDFAQKIDASSLYIKKYNINYVNLMSCPQVEKYLRDENAFGEAGVYVPRTSAAKVLLDAQTRDQSLF